MSPMWLLGLLLVPVIRWLHRGGRHRRTVFVSSLSLWRGSAISTPAAGERRPPDPAWRHRALMTALIFVALAEPQLPLQRSRITLWVDDSLSMQTRETQGTRLVQVLGQARRLLSEADNQDVEVRSLGDPWHSLGALGDGTVAALSASAGLREPAPPPGALLRRDRSHWLLTDGADAALLDWPGGRHPDRVIEVASVTRNAGLERISARRSASDPERIDLLLKITNGGTDVETREVVIGTDAGEAARSTQRIEPGTSALVSASIGATTRVRVRLEPGDALVEDDSIDLDLTPLRRRRVATDSKCPVALVAAVAAHPALAVAPDNAADVDTTLDCGTGGSADGRATIRVVADRVPTRLAGPLQWSSSVAESSRIRLDAEALQAASALHARHADVVLLAVGDAPVIVRRAGAPSLIETSLDFGSMGITRGPEVPLLVNLMFESVLGEHLLDRIAIVDRGPTSARVAPVVRGGAAAQSLPGRLPAASGVTPAADDLPLLRSWTWPTLAIALAVLLWEVVSLGRQWVRLSGNAGAALE
ncbi:MAG: hypothetical protein ACKVOX_03700 [Rhizobacter sp.]